MRGTAVEQGVLPISALLVDPQPGKQGLCGTRDDRNFRDKGTKALAGTLGMAGSIARIALFVSKPLPASRARHLSGASHSQLSAFSFQWQQHNQNWPATTIGLHNFH